MKCQECNKRTRTLYPDPRVPPLDDEPCLCDGCFKQAAQDRIDELQDEIASLEVAKTRRLQRGQLRTA